MINTCNLCIYTKTVTFFKEYVVLKFSMNLPKLLSVCSNLQYLLIYEQLFTLQHLTPKLATKTDADFY